MGGSVPVALRSAHGNQRHFKYAAIIIIIIIFCLYHGHQPKKRITILILKLYQRLISFIK